jgi:hypothetical protein
MIIASPWVPEHAPDWFWTLIANARGDRETLHALASALSQADLEDAYDYYTSLASFVWEDSDDDDAAGDLANWTVAQGKQFYFDVYEERRPPPTARSSEGNGFLGMLGRVYWERFQEELT